jgi:hypothetical protein
VIVNLIIYHTSAGNCKSYGHLRKWQRASDRAKLTAPKMSSARHGALSTAPETFRVRWQHAINEAGGQSCTQSLVSTGMVLGREFYEVGTAACSAYNATNEAMTRVAVCVDLHQ